MAGGQRGGRDGEGAVAVVQKNGDAAGTWRGDLAVGRSRAASVQNREIDFAITVEIAGDDLRGVYTGKRNECSLAIRAAARRFAREVGEKSATSDG